MADGGAEKGGQHGIRTWLYLFLLRFRIFEASYRLVFLCCYILFSYRSSDLIVYIRCMMFETLLQPKIKLSAARKVTLLHRYYVYKHS